MARGAGEKLIPTKTTMSEVPGFEVFWFKNSLNVLSGKQF
jgi:hypothetical protein